MLHEGRVTPAERVRQVAHAMVIPLGILQQLGRHGGRGWQGHGQPRAGVDARVRAVGEADHQQGGVVRQHAPGDGADTPEHIGELARVDDRSEQPVEHLQREAGGPLAGFHGVRVRVLLAGRHDVAGTQQLIRDVAVQVETHGDDSFRSQHLAQRGHQVGLGRFDALGRH